MYLYDKIHNSNVDGRQIYVSCKHIYNLLLLVLYADEGDDELIHNNVWSLVVLEKLLSHDPMV